MHKYSIIILAAGKSSRMGKPKQLLPFKGKTLIENAIDAAKESAIGEVVLVLGANSKNILEQIDQENISVCVNANWQQGVASSIVKGLQISMKTNPELKGVLIMTGDQPFVTADLLNKLILKYENTRLPIIASTFKDTMGSPAFFDKSLFSKLLELKGDVGAKKIIMQNKNSTACIPFQKGEIDIDTQQDYDNLKNDFR